MLPTPPEQLSPLARMVRSEAFPGVLLVACALLAIGIANSPWVDAWNHLWHTDLALTLGSRTLAKSLVHWINDGLMVLFFFFVGLEIKHEVLDGHLQSFRQAALPVAAALGGMAAPAGIYAMTILLHGAPEASPGWGIPMATDIAFALGVLALLGRRVPVGLKVFLASLAIADDLGAVLVIALFYTDEIAWSYLAFGAALLLMSVASNRLGVRQTWPYVVYGLLLWATFLQSGVHATIAGVALAMSIPARRRLDEYEFARRGHVLLDEFHRISQPDSRTSPEQLVLVQQLQRHAQDVQAPLQRMTRGLHPLVAHCIVPLFALANAGVDVTTGLAAAATSPAAHGVFLGLVLGKPLGILLATLLAARLLRAPLPPGVTWHHVHGIAWLAGIGFTMALFLNSLAFGARAPEFEAAKVAVLAASVLTGVVGFALLLLTPSAPPRPEIRP
ncbi:MAG: Na+/H+ antiporter NhaA [Planctomycetes bacterium]|nr:Na+/H+ antiporter NhaA [Planctomycetota bacterium]